MARKSSREAILDAGETVIARQGLTNTTLEAIATEAGISKGGLLYHFANKKELLKELILRNARQLEEKKQQIIPTLPDTPSRELKAYVFARMTENSRLNQYASKMVGIVEDDDLFSLVTNIKQQQINSVVSNSSAPEKVAIFLMAMEGFWMFDLFKLSTFTPEFRERIVNEMLAMIDQISCCEV